MCKCQYHKKKLLLLSIIISTFVQSCYTISTEKLDDTITDNPDSMTIIDARSFSDYHKGHIPNAVNLDLFAFHWNDTTRRGIHDFGQQAARLFSFAGCTKDKPIVIYDDKSGMLAARGVWMLLYMSYCNVYMLDGGFL